MADARRGFAREVRIEGFVFFDDLGIGCVALIRYVVLAGDERSATLGVGANVARRRQRRPCVE